MRSPEIRERFLHFFEGRGHRRLPSASLVTHDDPSVLFTVAGMVPLKPYFLGLQTPPAPRATSSQKCIRTPDIEEVGRSPRHHTFFEMLGNFSFGDYFKEGAIRLAWELLTEGYGLDPARLRPSVHPSDHEAEELWVEIAGIPRERVAHLEDNWWQPGPTGPCGFDSEIYWDWGGPCSCGRADCGPECEGDRWLEIWNLVFIEFDQPEPGVRVKLPRPSIDTGMGLERITAVLEGVRSNFETDLFVPLIEGFAGRTTLTPPEPGRTISLRVLGDHLRSAAFLVADGVTPGNEGRGYVLRRIIRRAGLHGRRLGLEGGLTAGVGDLCEVMGLAYPELIERRDHIERVLRTEEEALARTLSQGVERLDDLLATGGGRISGEDAFRLHDTFGLPVEITAEVAAERGAEVDMAGFEAAMEAQRGRSRAGAVRHGFEGGAALPATAFVGYETLEAGAEVVRIGDREELASLEAGGSAAVLLEPSPFYAEGGGQVGDTGTLEWEGGRARVTDTQLAPVSGARLHAVTVDEGTLTPGLRVAARVDAERRAAVARHHSATHLLHRALRLVLGDEVVQRGSWVGPDHTTFDFNFPRALTAAELLEVEHAVNDAIRRNLERSAEVMPIARARAEGAVMLFDEKYGEDVRVVDFGGWSRELCCGTHVARSGDLGAAILLSESSVGQGLRRIDMVAGEAAEERWERDAATLRETATALRVPPDEVAERVAALQARLRQLQRELEEAKRRALSGGGTSAAEVEDVAGVRLLHVLLDGDAGAEEVKAAVDSLYADRLGGDGIALVLGETALAVKVGQSAQGRGRRAGDLARAAAQATGSRAGGRADFANGGVGDASRRAEAVVAVREAIAAAGWARQRPEER
ncbi:MAG TPA: alanine--tRNA ligase [Candidatus Dormibacteraeota bacterium]|nr:alanine--tRNA ligase [Candidatus Dormibacteraeota bacterium]